MKKLNKDIMGYTKATVGLGIGTMIGAGMQSQLPAGSPNLTQGFNTMAGFMPIVGTVTMGKNVLGMTKKLKKGKY